MAMERTYQYRLYPKPGQERAMLRTLDACRSLYNHVLAERREAWHERQISLTRFGQEKELSGLRHAYTDYDQTYAHLLQDVVRRVDLSFQAFFRRVKAGQKPGYPRFKGAHRYDSFTYKEPGNGCVRIDQEHGRISFSKVAANVRCIFHRPILGKIRTVTVKRKASGWYALISCSDVPNTGLKPGNDEVGIDVGLSAFATLSTGESIPNPRLLKKSQASLAACQRAVSKKVKGSNRRSKTVIALRRKHEHVRNQRKDFQFKTARRLIQRFGRIAVEDINVKELIQSDNGTRLLRRSISDAAWGSFLRILGHKAEEAGGLVVRVEPRGTTQTCSGCGTTVPKTLQDRVHSCPACGLKIRRDHNAALNILARARTEPSWRAARG